MCRNLLGVFLQSGEVFPLLKNSRRQVKFDATFSKKERMEIVGRSRSREMELIHFLEYFPNLFLCVTRNSSIAAEMRNFRET